MSKLTVHCQGTPGWMAEFVRRSGVQYIKMIDPPRDNPFPGVRVIGRTYMPDGESNNMIRHGHAGGEAWFNHWRSFYESRPYVWAWEGPNEPQPMSDPSFRTSLDGFTYRWANLMRGRSWRTVGMCWGVGWPDEGHAAQMGGGVQACDYLAVHEYSARQMQVGANWLCLRYRFTVQELKAAGYRVPPILITECGIDGGVMGQQYARTGWKSYATEDEYLEQLKWYDSELMKDPIVEAAFPFTAGPNQDWIDFEITESLAMKLADHIANGTEPPEPPDPPEPPIGGDVETKILDAWGVERDSTWLRETYGPVGVTASESAEYGLVVLQEVVEAAATLIVSVRDAGDPVPGVEVAFSWPDGTVNGKTNDRGDVGFGMGGGAYYFPPDPGPHWITAGGVEVTGLGMLGGTPHNHVNVELWKEVPEPPEPEYNPLPGVIILDKNGNTQTPLWAHQMFGYQGTHMPPDADYVLAALVEAQGPDPVLRVKVVDAEGRPLVGKLVKLGSRSIQPPKRFEAVTDGDGFAELSMADKSFLYSAVDQQGPYMLIVADGDSEVYESAGVVFLPGGPDRWFNVVLKATKVEPPPEGDWARGVDVSSWQGAVNWQAVKDAGYVFAFIRASVCRLDGSLEEDARFAENWQGAGDAGLLRGVYHYLGIEARSQARFFVETVGEREPELGWWGHLEHNELDSQRCGEFLAAVDGNLAGRGRCDVLSRASFLDSLGALPWSVGRDLWVASLGQMEPVMPDAWDTWAFWQHGQGSVSGIEGEVGLDRFYGTVDDLYMVYGEPPDLPDPPAPPCPCRECCEEMTRLMREMVEVLEVIAAQ